MPSKATLPHIRHRLDQRERHVKHPDTLAIIRVTRLLCDEVEAGDDLARAAESTDPSFAMEADARYRAARRAREEMEL